VIDARRQLDLDVVARSPLADPARRRWSWSNRSDLLPAARQNYGDHHQQNDN
jgi:hypothetical protein